MFNDSLMTIRQLQDDRSDFNQLIKCSLTSESILTLVPWPRIFKFSAQGARFGTFILAMGPKSKYFLEIKPSLMSKTRP